MGHYAFLDINNVVTEVITGIDETSEIEGLTPEKWYGNFRGQSCKRTSYNNRIRKQYAGIGYRYDETADVFIAPKSYPSWVLDANHDWQPPVPRPTDKNAYYWDETLKQWVIIASK